MVTKGHKTTYAPVNLTNLCIIFSGGQFSILGGLGPRISTFLGPKCHWAVKFTGA